MLERLTATNLADICGGQWFNPPQHSFTGMQIDSRAMQAGDLFVALTGSQNDGHKFVSGLQSEQNQGAIVSQINSCLRIPQLAVESPKQALQQLAQHIASATTAKKIAITGSVGKTGTKDMLHHCLSGLCRTHATSGNYNNDIGAPLTVARMPADTQCLISELGMNHAGEIAPLSQMISPDIAIITRIADSHLGHFQSTADIADAKAEIFAGMGAEGTAILPADDAHFEQLKAAARAAGITSIITFGTDEKADIRLIDQMPAPNGQALHVRLNGKDTKLMLGMRAPHWAYSALICLAVAHLLGLPVPAVSAKLAAMGDLPGRGACFTLIQGTHKTTIIDDAYNAGPASMQAALTELATQTEANLNDASDSLNSGRLRKAAILSDMLELGDFAEAAHRGLMPFILASGVSHILLIGAHMHAIAAELSKDIQVACYDTAASAYKDALALTSHADVILVKGSHGSGAWQVSEYLAKHGNLGGVDVT